jgi:hypothetical protein
VLPDDVVRLPAGWYPDPTGLPQLRWWDNHAWTQHTTAARQPLIVQESPLAWADDLPTRRERREREREDRDTDDPIPPTAQSLLELAPPSVDDEPADEPAPAVNPDGAASGTDETENSDFDAENADDSDDAADESSYIPLSASGHAGRIPSIPPLTESAPERAASAARQVEPQPVVFAAAPPTVGTPLFDQVVAGASGPDSAQQWAARQSGAPTHDNRRDNAHNPSGTSAFSMAHSSTVPVWIMALLPLLQLVIVLLLVTSIGPNPSMELVMPTILVVLYVTTLALAFADYRLLRGNGVTKPAHWAWALLTAPIYLFVRAMVLTRTTGRGFGPVLVWFALTMLGIGSVLAVPGMLIISAPTVFSAQAEQSVTADAAATGASLNVSCPTAVPIIIGQTFSCKGSASNGKSYQIEVSLQRINGWINWRVDDWGANTLSR